MQVEQLKNRRQAEAAAKKKKTKNVVIDHDEENDLSEKRKLQFIYAVGTCVGVYLCYLGWTTFGGALGPAVLLVFGLLLAGSSQQLAADIGRDPIGALTEVLPTWFLVPFVVVAVLGLVGGAVLDIYSSGLSLLAAGVRIPRYLAAFVDGVIMLAGTVYVVSK